MQVRGQWLHTQRIYRRPPIGASTEIRAKGSREEQLKTYREALVTDHLHPELKSLNGDWTDRGKGAAPARGSGWHRQHRKGGNELEEQFYLGADPEAMPDYGWHPMEEPKRWQDHSRRATLREASAGGGSGILLRTLASILGRKCRPTKNTIRRLLTWISRGEAEDDEGSRAVAEVLDRARAEAQRFGLRRFAAKIGVDPANLAKVLAGKRRPSEQLLERFTTSNGG